MKSRNRGDSHLLVLLLAQSIIGIIDWHTLIETQENPFWYKAYKNYIYYQLLHYYIQHLIKYAIKCGKIKYQMGKIPFKSLCCTLRSGLYEIPTMIRTFPCGFEDNHACKWISGNFPGIFHMSEFLENCQISIFMFCCPPIHERRSWGV